MRYNWYTLVSRGPLHCPHLSSHPLSHSTCIPPPSLPPISPADTLPPLPLLLLLFSSLSSDLFSLPLRPPLHPPFSSSSFSIGHLSSISSYSSSSHSISSTLSFPACYSSSTSFSSLSP